MKDRYSFDDFIEIIARLRAKDGCPWDREQTHESLKENMLEEAYEAVDAINNNDMNNLKEELGDCLLQIALHSQIAKEEEIFTIDDVIDAISRKMILRHEHIFSDVVLNTTKDVLNNWEKIKKVEKGYSSVYEEVNGIAKSLPSLIRAQKVIKKSESISEATIPQITEEIKKCMDIIGSSEKLKENRNFEILGDVLLNMARISVFLKINAEFSLTKSIETFINKLKNIHT